MATTKPPNLSDLLLRVASAACLSSPCNGDFPPTHRLLRSPDDDRSPCPRQPEEADAPETLPGTGTATPSAVEVEALVDEVFQAVGAMKRAYLRLQEAHCPWDPEGMRAADGAVVAELRRLSRLRERFRRGRGRAGAALPLAEAVAPYEAALEDARREVREKEAEVEGLRERIRGGATAIARRGRGRARAVGKSRLPSPLPVIPTQELFVNCFSEVKLSLKSFTRHLLSLIRSSSRDISTSVVRSIAHINLPPSPGPPHDKHILSSYLCHKLFQGFEDESFYMEGSLSSLLHPSQHRRDCYAQFRDFHMIDPAAILGILPSCAFGKWVAKVYLSIMSGEVEAALLSEGSTFAEQRRVVEGGSHPRTGFYNEYLRVAKAVWMLHLLAFAVEPVPSHFEAMQGSEYEEVSMESVVKFPGGGVPSGWVVGFSVAPGFKLGNSKLVRGLVYPVPTPVGPL